jgi:uncharacterized Zn-binding protein involved in type VI secretion
MQNVRIGDISIGIGTHGLRCCPHFIVGTVIVGSPTTFANSLAMGRIGDTVVLTCPHSPIGFILTGSPDVLAENISLSRVNDKVNYNCGIGTLITGSSDVFSN